MVVVKEEEVEALWAPNTLDGSGSGPSLPPWPQPLLPWSPVGS